MGFLARTNLRLFSAAMVAGRGLLHRSKAVGYCLYRSKKENVAKQSFTKPNAKCSDCEQINPIAFAGTGCVDHLVEDGTIYHYVVTAIDAQGNTSSSSNEAYAQIPPTKESADSVPAGFYPLCRVTSPQ